MACRPLAAACYIGEQLGLDRRTLTDVCQTQLVKNASCTSWSSTIESPALTVTMGGSSPPTRTRSQGPLGLCTTQSARLPGV